MLRPVFIALLLFIAVNSYAEEFNMQGWIDEQVAAGRVLAVSAAHLKDGEVHYFSGGALTKGGDTHPDATTQFEIGSITKSFTDLLLAEMVERGQVSYDTTIGELLHGDVTFANKAVGEITLQQLATHTSGLPRQPTNLATTDPLDPYHGYDKKALLTGISIARAKQPLGNHYAYSNLGVGLLGYLLGTVHGEGYRAAVEQLVVGPLGLTQSGFTRASHSAAGFRNGVEVPDWSLDALAGAGSLRSTTTDLMRFARIQLGLIDNPLEHDLADDRVVIVDNASGFAVTRVWHVAESSEGNIFWHNGGTGGFWSFFGFKPGSNEAVAILISGDPEPTGLGLNWLGFKAPSPVVANVDETLFGQYQFNPSIGIGIYETGGRLVAQLSGQQPIQLHSVGDDWYAMDMADASVHFVRKDGDVAALGFVQNGALQNAARVADIAATVARDTQEVAVDSLEDYVGDYPINDSVKFTIRIKDDTLQAQLTGQPYVPVYPKGDDKFFYKIVDAELHFERDAEGIVNAVVLHQGGIVQRAERAN